MLQRNSASLPQDQHCPGNSLSTDLELGSFGVGDCLMGQFYFFFFSLGAWWHLPGGHREMNPNLVSKKSCCCPGRGSLLSSLGSLVSHCSMMQITWEVMQGESLGNTAYSLIYSNLWRIILHNHDITIWDKTVFCSQCFSTYLKGDLNTAKQC